MALQGPIPVQFSHVFPHGAFAAGAVEPVRDFEASKGDRFVQAKDRESGLPLWAVDVIDADPAARTRTARVKIAASDQPVLPPASPGMPFVPVEFTSLAVIPYVNQAGRLGLLAQGDRDRPRPGHARPLMGRASGEPVTVDPTDSRGSSRATDELTHETSR